MAKWYGMIGYGKNIETKPGVWEEQITEKPYYGDVIRNVLKNQNSSNLNDDVNVSNSISIVSDHFANNNFHSIKYVEFMGSNWKVPSVEVLHPRLILTIGGVYTG